MPWERDTQALVKQTDVVIIASTPFVPDTVRHLSLCGLTSNPGSVYRPDSVKRTSRVHESIEPVKRIPVVVEPHSVNVYPPAALVYQDEVPWGSAFNLPKPLGP